jgi:hypothetical protein
VAARAAHDNGDVVRGRCGRSVEEHQLSLLDTGHVVHGKDGVAGKALEQAIFDHQPCSTWVFLRRLEDQVERATETTMLRQVLRCCQQHRAMPVVATGVHHPLMATGVRQSGGFRNRQSIHVGTQPQALGATAALELCHQSSACQAAGNFIAPPAQFGGNYVGGANLLQPQLGVGMEVMSHVDEFLNPPLQGLGNVVHSVCVH